MSKIIWFIKLFFLVLTINLQAQQSPNILIKVVKNADNSVDLNYEKEVLGSFIVSLNFSNLENADYKSVPVLNVTDKSGFLFKLKPIDKNKKINLLFSYTITRGYLNPTVDSKAIYELPLKEGKKVTVYFGTRPGISSDKWKKYIIYSKTQDGVFFMRKGIVVELRTLTRFDKDDKNLQTNKAVTKEIVVEHADGTFASYAGIDEKSIAVKVGQTVNSHEYLGLMDKSISGSYSLTFDVYYHETNENDFRGNLVNTNPSFITQNGVEKLESKKEYEVKHI